MKSHPLIGALAILILLLAVTAVGHYMMVQKIERVKEKAETLIKVAEEGKRQINSLQNVEKRVELKEQARPKIDLSKFEAAVKHTE